MESAKEILNESIEDLRGVPDLEIALRVYGHQSMVNNTFQDCNDTKLEVPFGKNTIDEIKKTVKYLNLHTREKIYSTKSIILMIKWKVY